MQQTIERTIDTPILHDRASVWLVCGNEVTVLGRLSVAINAGVGDVAALFPASAEDRLITA